MDIDDASLVLPHPTSGGSLAIPRPLLESVKRYAREAKSENTRKAYRKAWGRFERWCHSMRLTPLPCSREVLVLYLTHLAEQGRRPSVLDLTVAALSDMHALHGYEKEFPKNDAMVKAVRQGIRRTKTLPLRQATPLMPKQLKMVSAGLPETLAGRRDRAIFLLGFAGAFRISELSFLRIEDLSFGDEGITVLLRFSKTDQEHKGRHIGIPFGHDPMLCPVRAVQAWLEHSHLKKGYLFRQVSRYDDVLLAQIGAQSIAAIIHNRATEAGVVGKQISGHSLRAGFVTTAARAKKTIASIQKQTGHKSVEMVVRYMRQVDIFDDNAASDIGL